MSQHLTRLMSPLQALNEGLGEGIFYRGKILLGLCVDVYSSPSAVSTEPGSVTLGKVIPCFPFYVECKEKWGIYP